jgi:ribosomal-protein-alanine N-acetyltransferase
MTSNDIARITAIEAVCFPIDQWGQKTLARCISHSQLHCRALIKNTPTPRGIRQDIVGYAIYKIDLLYNTPDRHHTASWEGHLMCIAIAPEHQRQGYGRWLLNQLIMEITQTPGVIRITLEVRETNARAQKLYQSVGFQASSRTPAYYLPQAPGASPEAAIIMTRDTPPRSATHQATPRARNAA